jgi:uncharacterized cupredoxin-like copper-binding protein
MQAMKTTSAAIFAAAMAAMSANAFAATTVMVEESGESGGKMAIAMDKTELPAGEVVFVVANAAVTEEHEMVLVKLKNAGEKIVVDTKTHRIDEKAIDALGEIADLKPSDKGELKADLTPGSYVLLCNLKGHYEAGMSKPFTVTGTAASN